MEEVREVAWRALMSHRGVPETLVRITASRFCAGLVAKDGVVAEAAPILRKIALGKTGREVAEICERHGWRWEVVARAGEKK